MSSNFRFILPKIDNSKDGPWILVYNDFGEHTSAYQLLDGNLYYTGRNGKKLVKSGVNMSNLAKAIVSHAKNVARMKGVSKIEVDDKIIYQESADNAIEIHYKDGKPVRKKVDPLKEVTQELHKDIDADNLHDDIKSALYADQPKAKAKMDKSITARQMNMLAESYIKSRNEAKFDTKRNGHKITILTEGFIFDCDDEKGTIETTQVPENGLKMSLKSKRLIGADIDVFFDEIDKHLERNRQYKR